MMKQKVIFILLNEYTDWEGAFLSTALHVGVVPGSEIKYEVCTVAPTLDAVRSIGGLRTLPDYSFTPLVREAMDKGKIVGAICNGVSFLCSHGFLNDVKHTGNGLDQLKQWGGEKYTNEAEYVEAQAISDKNIVTANGVGHLEFTREMLLLLKANTPEKIAGWYDFYKNGFVR